MFSVGFQNEALEPELAKQWIKMEGMPGWIPVSLWKPERGLHLSRTCCPPDDPGKEQLQGWVVSFW